MADGRYMSIDQDEVVEAIATPFDKDIVRLGEPAEYDLRRLRERGEARKERQAAQDSNAAAMGAEATVQRSVAKAGRLLECGLGPPGRACRANRWTLEK